MRRLILSHDTSLAGSGAIRIALECPAFPSRTFSARMLMACSLHSWGACPGGVVGARCVSASGGSARFAFAARGSSLWVGSDEVKVSHSSASRKSGFG